MTAVLSFILLILAITIILVIIRLNSKKSLKAVIIVGIVCIITVMGCFLSQLLFYYTDHEVSISILPDDDLNYFTLEFENHKLHYEHTYIQFASSLNLIEIQEVINKTYPKDKLVSDQKGIKITKDNHVIMLEQVDTESFLWQSRNIYELQAECICLEESENHYISIPFPNKVLSHVGAYEKEMKVNCTIEELKEFYQDFTNVNFEDNTIILEEEKRIKLTIQGNILKISIEKIQK